MSVRGVSTQVKAWSRPRSRSTAERSRVFGKALELFEGDFAGARQWLASPQPGLRGERPILLANTDVGAREVEALIARLEHGVLT